MVSSTKTSNLHNVIGSLDSHGLLNIYHNVTLLSALEYIQAFDSTFVTLFVHHA